MVSVVSATSRVPASRCTVAASSKQNGLRISLWVRNVGCGVTSVGSGAILRRARGRVDSAPHHLDVAHRTNLYAAGAGPGELRGDPDRLIHVPGFDEIKAAEDFLGFTERAVGDLGLAVADAHRFRCFHTLEHLRLREMSVPAQLVGVREAVAHHSIGLRPGQRVVKCRVVVDHEDEFHASSIPSAAYAASTSRLKQAKITSLSELGTTSSLRTVVTATCVASRSGYP